ncbi:LytR family transcriptional regulator [Occultella glacieicola]|uniref:LytR family transcriptional regulator n=1 Tax=Occultella glacieicola TaxID=2518684 RepID=A0ABY2E3I8_9MICO|nr:LytR C-terminal domain-containing protein [Occultella glacieicola]TDE94198.1 LytR family transcriptional regulator [Occultella glacieicola]
MSNRDYPHPEDEFDALGADRTPQGVHRAPQSRWRQLLPFLVVIILAPLLAFGAVRLLSGGFGGTDDPTGAASSTTEPGEPTPTDATTEAPTEEPTTEEPTTEEPADLDQDLSVYVLNGAGVSGLAGAAAEALTDEGWTNVTPENYSRELPTSSAVFYTTADMAEEAAAVGELLGVTDLIEDSSAASDGIVVVLREDFRG